MCIKFASNALGGDSEKHINIITLTQVSYPRWQEKNFNFYNVKNPNNNSINFYESDLNNQTICVPISSYRHEIYFNGDTENLNIENFYISFHLK